MADFLDLNSRTSKLQKEQEKRREAARLRIKRERASKEAAARELAKIEQQIRQRKLEQMLKEKEELERAEAERARTAGIQYRESLLPVPAEGEGDKVLLPPSALESLTRQEAVTIGPMFFEISHDLKEGGAKQEGALSSSGSRTTHAGVLEFVAAEGTIGLPRKVVSSLLGSHNLAAGYGSDGGPESLVEKLGSVSVKYVRLAKATFAKVVPETVGLSQVSELRAMLEDNLRNHATLTVGDRVSVWRRGKEFSMKVVELRPEASVTLIDTDMEIELDLPDEAREQLEAKDARERAHTLRAHMDPAPSSAAGTDAGAGAGAAPTGASTGRALSPVAAAAIGPSRMEDDDADLDSDDEEAAASKNAFDPEKHRLAKLEALPEEPAKAEEGVFTCQLRSSQGKFARRFRHGDRLGLLLDFAEAHGGVPGRYRVVIPFPRKVFTREDASAGMTLKDAGLTSRQEAVILERF